MSIKEHSERIRPGPEYKYQLPQIKVAFVPPQTPLEKHLFFQFRAAFESYGDQVIMVEKGKFPQDTNVAFRFDQDLEEERRPNELQSRHRKPRNHKKAVYILTLEQLDPSIVNEPANLSRWMRGILVKKACHNAIVIEGNPQNPSLHQGARAIITSMEGNVGIETFRSDGQEFFTHLVERLKLLGGAEMINTKDKRETTAPTFEAWCQRKVVQEIAYASRLLGKNGLLWDLDLRKFPGIKKEISRRQLLQILRTLKQAGLGEGNLSGIDEELRVMAITETGVSKPRINPWKGEVAAVPEITENGTVHWVMRGFPKGHPVTLFWRSSIQDVGYFLTSAFKRQKLLQDIFTQGWVEHPPSIEAKENGQFYLACALLKAGKITTFEDFLRYLDEGFSHSDFLPVIPEGIDPAANAAIHIHKEPIVPQSAPFIKIVNPDIRRLGYRHSPPCGSWESAVLPLLALFQSYQEFGPPVSKEEIRGGVMIGHGCFLWGYQGAKHLADNIVSQIKFKNHVSYF